MSNPATETQSAFAQRIGVGRSRVHALKSSGRLVMDGDLVNIEASLEQIKATTGRKLDLLERVQQVGAGETAITEPAEPPPSKDDAPVRRLDAQARTDHLRAELLQIDLDERRAKLLRADDVAAHYGNTLTIFRTRLEAFPDTLAAQLSGPLDEAQRRAVIAETIEHLLHSLAGDMSKLGLSA